MLAQRISSINSLAAICEASGANISEVATAVGVDSRIGKHMLKASAGFGGSCFKKDVLSLVYIAQSLHLYEVASYWQNVVTINEYSKARFAKRIVSALHGSLRRKKIAIFGWAYKRNTGDSRESAAIGIALQLLAEGAELAVYDPQVSFDPEQIYRDLENEFPAARSRVRVCKDPVQACRSACAVVIMTEWDQFKSDRLPLYSFNEDDQGGKSNNRTIISVNTAASSDSGIDLGDDMADCCPAADGANSEHIQHLNDRVDWQKIADVVRRPRLIFDGRNVVDARALATVGFTVESIGKSTV
jgi:UDPglucose 6-dehydrogenase